MSQVQTESGLRLGAMENSEMQAGGYREHEGRKQREEARRQEEQKD